VIAAAILLAGVGLMYAFPSGRWERGKNDGNEEASSISLDPSPYPPILQLGLLK